MAARRFRLPGRQFLHAGDAEHIGEPQHFFKPVQPLRNRHATPQRPPP